MCKNNTYRDYGTCQCDDCRKWTTHDAVARQQIEDDRLTLRSLSVRLTNLEARLTEKPKPPYVPTVDVSRSGLGLIVALSFLRTGKKIRRANWNNKSTYLCIGRGGWIINGAGLTDSEVKFDVNDVMAQDWEVLL